MLKKKEKKISSSLKPTQNVRLNLYTTEFVFNSTPQLMAVPKLSIRSAVCRSFELSSIPFNI